jgi:hypothetical protein
MLNSIRDKTGAGDNDRRKLAALGREFSPRAVL